MGSVGRQVHEERATASRVAYEIYGVVSIQVGVAYLRTLVGDYPTVLVDPDPLMLAGAALLTRVADLSGKPERTPLGDVHRRDQKEGAVFDGSKAERELGVTYTPIRQAIEEEIAFLQR